MKAIIYLKPKGTMEINNLKSIADPLAGTITDFSDFYFRRKVNYTFNGDVIRVVNSDIVKYIDIVED